MKCIHYPGSLDIELLKIEKQVPVDNECSDDGEAVTILYSNALCRKHFTLRILELERFKREQEKKEKKTEVDEQVKKRKHW